WSPTAAGLRSLCRISEEALVTTGPGDEQAVPPRRLRASHVDREQAISALKAAFVHGRLTSDEFDARVGQALAARTRAELAVITADIPVGVPNGAAGVSDAAASVPVYSGGAVQPAAAWSAGSAAASEAALAVTGVVIFTLFVTGYQLRESRHHGRSAQPQPPGTAR